jgi:hypothetical protein
MSAQKSYLEAGVIAAIITAIAGIIVAYKPFSHSDDKTSKSEPLFQEPPSDRLNSSALWDTITKLRSDNYRLEREVAALKTLLKEQKTDKPIVLESSPEGPRDGRTKQSPSTVEIDTRKPEPRVSQYEESYKLISWNETAGQYEGQLGQLFFLGCPPNGAVKNNLYGNGTYTIDSNICTAAVHDGMITAKDGGSFYLEIIPSQGYFIGMKKNGVRSAEYRAANGFSTFRFVKK